MLVLMGPIASNFVLKSFFQQLKLPVHISLVVGQILLLLIPVIFYFIITKEPVKETLKLNYLKPINVVIIFAIAVVIQPIGMFLSALSNLFFENNVVEIFDYLNPLPLWVRLGVLALTPAICEEVVMRGVIFSGYKHVRLRTAALMNGLIFGLFHLNPQQFLYAFALGVLFVYLVDITQSIFASMIAHFSFNGIQTVWQWYGTQNTETALSDITSISLEQKLALIGFLFVLTVIFIPILNKLLKVLRKVNNDVFETRDVDVENNSQAVVTWHIYAIVVSYLAFILFNF